MIGIRLHLLLLGIIICVVVYMYLVCRDVKRIEHEMHDLKLKLESTARSLEMVIQPPTVVEDVKKINKQTDTLEKVEKCKELAKCKEPEKSDEAEKCEVVDDHPEPGFVDDEGVDAISEDLRDMLTRIEEEEFSTSTAPEPFADIPVELLRMPSEVVATTTSERSISFTESELKSMKIDDIRKLLRDLNMDVTGKKDVLIARLVYAAS
ncbi:hypothetical protein TSOC_000535 [Tetrabaena socialis]|uniref:SAP domain-containing protein n=1 Tax=Tetrabaena socialis TaxID=47790 RepID=A0A2J8AJ74_9CHLO|nr:hypothetical protein TSOC_000535 [Tetrabaena socialis]|eukprot:PNH12569.1 hypothetical protein TSOC_000535 [Tetrabaena socialis]